MERLTERKRFKIIGVSEVKSKTGFMVSFLPPKIHRPVTELLDINLIRVQSLNMVGKLKPDDNVIVVCADVDWNDVSKEFDVRNDKPLVFVSAT